MFSKFTKTIRFFERESECIVAKMNCVKHTDHLCHNAFRLSLVGRFRFKTLVISAFIIMIIKSSSNGDI